MAMLTCIRERERVMWGHKWLYVTITDGVDIFRFQCVYEPFTKAGNGHWIVKEDRCRLANGKLLDEETAEEISERWEKALGEQIKKEQAK